LRQAAAAPLLLPSRPLSGKQMKKILLKEAAPKLTLHSRRFQVLHHSVVQSKCLPGMKMKNEWLTVEAGPGLMSHSRQRRLVSYNSAVEAVVACAMMHSRLPREIQMVHLNLSLAVGVAASVMAHSFQFPQTPMEDWALSVVEAAAASAMMHVHHHPAVVRGRRGVSTDVAAAQIRHYVIHVGTHH